MQFNYSTLAASLALALTLTGCNDSDSNNTVSGNTIKVIDGYLSQAEVCIDRNNNQSCDTGEALSTLTNAKGEITIPEADAKHPIIARAIAGKTTDSDKAGALGNSYELIAEAGSKVVTPFTTMAKVQQKTLDELATDLNLPSDVISGDYVAMKASEEKAKEAHLLARSVTTELAPSVKDNQASTLATTTQTIQTEINNQVNAGANLDDITIEVDDSGKASSATIIRSLDAYLKDGDSQFTSMNQYYALKEGIFKVKVSGDGELTVTNKSGATDTTQYSTDGNALVLTDGKNTERDTFIYITEDLSLSVTDQSDLTLWTKGSLTTSKTLTKAHFDGKTWYYLSDDAPKDSSKAQPMVAKMVFGQDKVTITEPYGKNPTDAMELPWEIKNDKLIVDFPEGEADFNVTLYLEDTNMMAVYNSSATRAGVYDLLIKDKTMADTLYTTWKSVK